MSVRESPRAVGGGVGQRPSPTGIVDRLQLPIVLGPTAGGPGTTRPAAAVSEAGGLGFVPAGYRSTKQLYEDVVFARGMTLRLLSVCSG